MANKPSFWFTGKTGTAMGETFALCASEHEKHPFPRSLAEIDDNLTSIAKQFLGLEEKTASDAELKAIRAELDRARTALNPEIK